MDTAEVVKMLQVAVTPVVLISGVGLLLLSMTNRLGRVVDRARVLAKEMRSAQPEVVERLRNQLQLLYRRAALLRTAIFASSLSILLVSVLILGLFAEVLLGLSIAPPIIIVFAACILALIVSMVFFLKDLTLSLRALRVEISDEL
jgi:hypothetical protein